LPVAWARAPCTGAPNTSATRNASSPPARTFTRFSSPVRFNGTPAVAFRRRFANVPRGLASVSSSVSVPVLPFRARSVNVFAATPPAPADVMTIVARPERVPVMSAVNAPGGSRYWLGSPPTQTPVGDAVG
jgi:hypothetical protein